MTIALANWFGRLLSSTARAAPDRQHDAPPPLKIEVERLPDYLWRELGFQPVQRPEELPWRRE